MSPLDSWIFVAETFAVLFVFWKLLNLTADQFDHWLRGLRAAREERFGAIEPPAEDGGKPLREKELSA